MPPNRRLDVSAANSEQLVRFVLESWYRHSAGAKTRPIAKALNKSTSATVEWIKGATFNTEERRAELRLVEDELGIDHISRLWRTIAASFDQKYVLRADAQWWPVLRRQARFRCAVDVLVAADAAIEDLAGTPPDQLRPADRIALERVATGLAQVQAGPYGFTSEAYLRLVLVLPYAVEAIADFSVRSPVGFRVLRTFDRGLRRYEDSPEVVGAAHHLVDHYFDRPISLRSVNQLRLARRAAWLSDDPARARAIGQRLAAVACERRRDLLQRRCAAWYLAELSGRSPVTDHWDAARGTLASERSMSDIANVNVRELANETRPTLPFRDVDFAALPAALPTTRDGETVLDAVLGTTERPHTSRHLATALHSGTAELLRDALRTPCPIRWRTIVETLHAAAPEVQTYAVGRLCAVADADATATTGASVDHLVQRALLLLANLQPEPKSLKTLRENANNAAASPQVRATAVWGIGDNLLTNPQLPRDEAMATVERALRDPSPAVRQAAIHSVASTRESRLIASVEDAATLDDDNDRSTANWAAWAISLMRSDSL